MLFLRLLPLVFFLLAVSANSADAKIMLITRGDTIAFVGNPKSDDGKEVNLANIKVGYKYSYFGLFWVDFWTYGGEYCVYTNENDKTFFPISAEVAAGMLKTTPNKLSRPFWFRFPPGLVAIVGIVVLLVGASVLTRRGNRRRETLLEQSEYQKALAAVLDTTSGNPERERFDDAIKELVYSGVSEAQARKNLNFLVQQQKSEATT